MVEVLTHNQSFASPGEALAHYGKKGMRWGVRNEDKPPGLASSPRAEKKQEKRDSKAAMLRSTAAKTDIRVKELDTEISALPTKGVGNYYKKAGLMQQKAEAVKRRDDLNTAADAVEAGRLTSNQKKLLVGGVVAAGLFGAMYLNQKHQTGELNALKLRGQAALQGKKFDFRKNDNLKNAKTPDEVQAWVNQGINPNYNNAGGVMNCRRCTFAYELRRRGYDVSATISNFGMGQSETGLRNALTPGSRNLNRLQSMSMGVSSGKGIRALARGDNRDTPGGERYSIPDANKPNALRDLLRQQPDGARGEAVFNFGGFGHSLAYERFGDKTYIFDTQKGQRYSVDRQADLDKFLNKWGIAKDVQVTRLDNVPLDTKFLARWATNANTTAPQAPRAPSAPSRPTLSLDQIAKAAGERPAGMHITTWNALQREAGMV